MMIEDSQDLKNLLGIEGSLPIFVLFCEYASEDGVYNLFSELSRTYVSEAIFKMVFEGVCPDINEEF